MNHLATARAAVVAIFVLLFAIGEARAQERLDEIEAQQQQLDRVAGAILASQGRLLQAPSTTSAQDRAYNLLHSAHDSLLQVDRELSALYKLMLMQQLISGNAQVKTARRIVDQQRGYTQKVATGQANYVEKLIQKASESETSRLLLEARDALKSTAEMLQRQ